MRRLLVITLVSLAAFLAAVVAWALWTAPGTGGASGTSGSLDAATISVPASAYNAVTITWSEQAALQPASLEDSAITYVVQRKLGAGSWAAVPGGSCAGALPHGVTSCSNKPATGGTYSYRVVATYATWTAVSDEDSVVLTIDKDEPTNAITLSDVTGAALKSAATVYYRGVAAGSFTLTNTLTDTGAAGPASSETAALSGGSTGWTHSPSLVSAPAGGPYVSSAFSWSAFTTSAPTEIVTGSDAGGNLDITVLTFSDDSAGPTGGSVDATGLVGTGGRYSTSTALSLAFGAGSDAGSGLATSGARLRRASASLSAGSCGTYGDYAQVGADDPATPVANTVPDDNTCYRYEYVVLDRLGNQTTYTSPDIKVDTAATGPSGGSVNATGLVGTGGRYSTSTALSLDLAKGSDASGLAPSGAQLRRSTATLTSGGTANGSCGTYDASVPVGGDDPASPAADTVPAGQACYRYEYVVADMAGNSTTYTSTEVKVDTSAPAAPSLAFSALTNTYASGSTLYYRSNAASGAFTVTAAATDTDSGIAGYAFPSLPAGWAATPGGAAVNTYSWSAANPTVPSGAQNVTATNHATRTSVAGFTVVADNAPPTTGSVTYTDGAYGSESVSVSFANGSDGGSGVDAATGVLERSSAQLTGSSCGTFSGFTTVASNPSTPYVDSTVIEGRCYQYRYKVSDNLAHEATYTNANMAKITPRTYLQTVTTTAGLVNHWRLGQAYVPVATDTFTGTAGTVLTARTGELGATWSNWGAAYGVTSTLVLSNPQGRVRKNGTTYNYYRASATAASADYAVEADVHVKTLVTGDRAGVVGRFDPVTNLEDWYEASYDRTTAVWQLRKTTNQALAAVGTTSAQTLTAGQTYRLRLEMIGSTLRLYVDGALKITYTDPSPLTAVGKPGIFSGNSNAASTGSDTTGMHLDNFRVVPTSAATVTDSKGTATGTHVNGVTLGAAGALSADANTAMTFDGVDDYVSAARQVQDDLSLEFWFKSTQGIGTAAAWTAGAGMVDASIAGTTNNDFGVSLRSDGRVVAGVGNPDTSVVSTTGAFNNGAWHHVVFTRVKATGALKLYVDGNPEGTGTGNVNALTGQATINFGRLASAANYFAGSLDEVATYNVALSPEAVLAHRQRGIGL